MFNRNCCGQNNFMPNYGGQGCCQRQMTNQVIEPTINKCIQKDFYHEVPQV